MRRGRLIGIAATAHLAVIALLLLVPTGRHPARPGTTIRATVAPLIEDLIPGSGWEHCYRPEPIVVREGGPDRIRLADPSPFPASPMTIPRTPPGVEPGVLAGRLDLYDGGPGGIFGARSEHRNLRAHGGGKRTEAAVDTGLDWLMRHQQADGSWRTTGFHERCVGERCTGTVESPADLEATSLALLAFLGAGETHRRGPHPHTVRRGLRFLLAARQTDGSVGPTDTPRRMHVQAFAANAFVEAWVRSGSPALRAASLRTLRFLVDAQRPYRGWGDVAVTADVLITLKIARAAGLEVPRESIEWAVEELDRATDPVTGLVGGDTTLTARAVFARTLARCGAWRKPLNALGAAQVHESRPTRPEDPPQSWYYAVNATFHVRGPEFGNYWRDMRLALVERQLPHQRTDGCARGSWDPNKEPRGRVVATALLTMCFETFYRYAICFGSG